VEAIQRLRRPDPGSAILRCCSARTPAGVTSAMADCLLFLQPLTTSPSPFIMASKPILATSAGSSFFSWHRLVQAGVDFLLVRDVAPTSSATSGKARRERNACRRKALRRLPPVACSRCRPARALPSTARPSQGPNVTLPDLICRGPPTRPCRWDSPLHNRD
jgi:hypothetical protein